MPLKRQDHCHLSTKGCDIRMIVLFTKKKSKLKWEETWLRSAEGRQDIEVFSGLFSCMSLLDLVLGFWNPMYCFFLLEMEK
jgi:hypothetical protein